MLSIFIINRISGEHFFPEYGHDLIISTVNIDCDYVNTRHHDLLYRRISKVKHIINDFLLFTGRDSFFMTDFHNGPDLVFRVGFRFFIRSDTQQEKDAFRKEINRNGDRSKDDH